LIVEALNHELLTVGSLIRDVENLGSGRATASPGNSAQLRWRRGV
jgi:hypothetical protein